MNRWFRGIRLGLPRRISIVAIPLLVAGIGGGLAPVRAQGQSSLPPLRQLSATIAVTRGPSFSEIDGVVGLRDGRALIDDPTRGGLFLFDSGLAHGALVAPAPYISARDEIERAHPLSLSALIPYVGDSVIFADGATHVLWVVDPTGRIIRQLPVPSGVPIGAFVDHSSHAQFDTYGRLVFQMGTTWSEKIWPNAGFAASPFAISKLSTRSPVLDLEAHMAPSLDTISIVRADLVSGAIDTIGGVVEPRPTIPVQRRLADRSTISVMELHPIPLWDAMAVISDGSVALIRGRDYHIDWMNADGARRVSPPVNHVWHALTTPDKIAIIDSIHRVRALGAAPDTSYRADRRSLVGTIVIPSASELPDSLPPFGPAAALADADDNLWIRQSNERSVISESAAAATPELYDIVNRSGQLVDRVQLPTGFGLVGFGPGVVYVAGTVPAATSLEPGIHVMALRIH